VDAVSPERRSSRDAAVLRVVQVTQGSFDRGLAGLEHVRDLGRSENEYVAQDQDRALSRWQVLEGGDKRQADRLLELIARLRPGRGIGDRVEEGVRVGVQPNRLAAPRGLGRLGDRLHPTWATPLVPHAFRERFVAIR
jgi:hypothetical protein